ncbi:MAG: thiol peroxidase [Colwellia sp.]|nr:thiol peroxidase [Colwellia sp.]
MKLSNLLLTIALTLTFHGLTSTIVFATSFQQGNLQQTTDLVKANNKFVTLLGSQIDVGQIAPNFKVVNENFVAVMLSDFSGKNVLISVVPSLDTGVCSLQTKRFNEEVINLPKDVVMLTISNDLPFAQKRFCKTENIDKLQVLSDSVWRDFGSNYGLLIKDMGLLTRAIFIIDSSGKVAYKEIVANISKHPNYELALATLTALSPTDVTHQTSSTKESKK